MEEAGKLRIFLAASVVNLETSDPRSQRTNQGENYETVSTWHVGFGHQ